MDYLSRLSEIIDLSYKLLCNKVWGGDISIINEATMQLQFGLIIKNVGKQFEFSKDDRFDILLETPQDIESTIKTPNGQARCDIKLHFYRKSSLKSTAYIELKFFKQAINQAVTDNRFSVYKDLLNLEQYLKSSKNSVAYEIVCTNNPNYSNPNTISKINIGNNVVSKKEIEYGNKVIRLNSIYTFIWDMEKSSEFEFLKIQIGKNQTDK